MSEKIKKVLAKYWGYDTFLPLQKEVLHVHPVPDEALARHALGLCDLILMVGEDEIFSTQVDIQRLAQFGDAPERAHQYRRTGKTLSGTGAILLCPAPHDRRDHRSLVPARLGNPAVVDRLVQDHAHPARPLHVHRPDRRPYAS